MAASSSNLASVANPSSSLAAVALPNGELRWSIAEFKEFGLHMHSFIQTEQLPVKHLGGMEAVVDGLNTSFRLLDEHSMTKFQAELAHPLTKVLSHGVDMFGYPFFICVAGLLIRVLFSLLFFLCCCDM